MKQSEKYIIEEVFLTPNIASTEHNPEPIGFTLARGLGYFIVAVLEH